MKFMIFGTGPVGIVFSVAFLLLIAGFTTEAVEAAEFGNDIHEFQEILGLVNTGAGLDEFTIITTELGSEEPMVQEDMTTKMAIQMGVFPSNMVIGDKVQNRWGGAVIVGHTPEHRMYLYTDKLSKDVCRAVISRNVAGFQYVGVDWKDMTDAKTAMGNCSDGENTLVMSFDPQYSLDLLRSVSN